MPENAKENAGDGITLDLLPRDGERALRELAGGNLVIARSDNDFLYIAELDGRFHMFTHTPGASGGGQRQFPKNEKYLASVRKLAELSDAMYVCIFDKTMNLYGVLQSAEDGILSMFPGNDRDGDADIEFLPWDKSAAGDAPKTQTGGNPPPDDSAPGSDFPSEHFDDLFDVE
jgi:hypothetical protein